MIRTQTHKLILRPSGDSELYSYADDPLELRNRFGDPKMQAICDDLKLQLLEWYIKTTGIAPFDKDQRGLPACYPTPVLAGR